MPTQPSQSPEEQDEGLPSFRGMQFFQKTHRRGFTPKIENRSMGYGLFPFARDIAPMRASAVAHLLGMIDANTIPGKTADNLMAMAVVRQMLADVFLEGSFDWFTTSYNFGQVSGRLALQASRSLADLRSHVVSGAHELVERTMDDLMRLAVPEMLDNYLVLDRDPSTDQISDAVGWAYVLWTPDRPGVAAIGVTPDTVMDEIENLQDDYPDLSPFGVLSAWQVADPSTSAKVVEDAVLSAYTGEDVFHKLKPDQDGRFEILTVKERIETSLVEAKQLVLSPWHIDEQMEKSATAEDVSPSFLP